MKIELRGAQYSANLGITKKEKQFVQPVIMDIVMHPYAGKNSTGIRAHRTDDINDTINYSEVNKLIQKTLDEREFHLIETLAETIAGLLLQSFRIETVDLTVKKPQALKNVDYTAVNIVRSNTFLDGSDT